MAYRTRPNQLRSQAARPAPIASLSEPIPPGLAELHDAGGDRQRRERPAAPGSVRRGTSSVHVEQVPDHVRRRYRESRAA